MNNNQLSDDFYFSINSPIGYSKAPIQYYPNTSPTPKQSPPLELPAKSPSPQLLTFDKLPIELIIQVISQLSQFEILNLCRVNKKLYQLSYPKLFENIVVDSKFNIFDKEFTTVGVTYVNSSYNLKKFIRVINSHKGGDVFSFLCISLPEAIDIYDNHVFSEFLEMFSNLVNLKTLVWLYDVFRFEFLYNLKRKDILNVLVLNIKSNSISNERITTNLRFTNLTNFQIQPFYNAGYLENIVDNMLINNDNSKLRVLGLTRHPELQANHGHPFDDTFSIRNVFERMEFSELSVLSLNDILVNENDAKLLVKSASLHRLSSLHLCRVIERSTTSSFLIIIGEHLKNLVNLALDIEESMEHLPEFLSMIPILSTLDITIRKQSSFETYSTVITRHKRNLTKLSLELVNQEDNLLNDIPDLFYLSLSRLTELTSLRINSSNNSSQEPVGLLSLVASLASLEYLEVFGNQAGGMPNLGLDMLHPTVFDGWFKVQHVVFIYLRQNKNLKYVKINDCLFECDSEKYVVSPKDGIDNWFNMNVRVNMMLYLT
ncbi:hypothetical protein Cantr_09709 [Candida viswanathii]|uniref:F-box domain-containing protein n=1 Tax=Candida viswanathii TaxID=5486 RepID=A0A367YBD5_9ASCO|nr:hypothetical protein Cantr_09709 [Candida viswanathii]